MTMANLVNFLCTSVPHTISFYENFNLPYIKKLLDLNYINIYAHMNIEYQNQKKIFFMVVYLQIIFFHLSHKNMIVINHPRFHF